MIFSIYGVRGATLRATDGTVGAVEDFYIDDATWHVRYLVADTGGWLGGRLVLITPAVLGAFDMAQREFPVSLTRDQVEHSPDIATDKPVSRQQESRLHDYYGWTPYWPGFGAGMAAAPAPMPGIAAPAYTGDPVLSHVDADAVAAAQARSRSDEGDPHLRSAREITGYYIQATDGDIGHVEDFLADDADWAIRYMIVDTRNWLPGKKVLISPQWIEDVSWSENRVRVDLTRDQIRRGPEYDPATPIDRDYENRLFSFYGRAPYW
jgi:hypothetical protein